MLCLCRCIACPADHYCFQGASNASGVCPSVGFHCSRGILTLLPGYWITVHMRNSSEGNGTAPLVVSFSASQCSHAPACAGGAFAAPPDVASQEGLCQAGYSGADCARCDPRFVQFVGHCLRPSSIAALSIIVLVSVVVVGVAFVATLSLEETRGVALKRTMWVLGWKDVVMFRFKLLHDFLQVVAVIVTLHKLEPVWFVVRAAQQ